MNKYDGVTAIAADESTSHIFIYSKQITSHCSFISEAVEGTAAQLAGTVALNSNSLNFSDYYSVVGPRCKGYHLGKDDSERRLVDDIDSAGKNVHYLLLLPSANTI